MSSIEVIRSKISALRQYYLPFGIRYTLSETLFQKSRNQNGINQANLKKALVNEWYDVDGSIIKVLDIDDDEMEYRLETGYRWMDTSLGTYDWKPVSGNKIKIKRFGDKYETFTVELNDDKDVLKISPAITSTDSSETWYHLD